MVGDSHGDENLGSVLNHVLLHQTVIGLETKQQLQAVGEKPDYIVGGVGGGSNFAGLMLPFLPLKFAGEDMTFIAAEPKACPSLIRGTYRYDFGDISKTNALKQPGCFRIRRAFFLPPAPETSHAIRSAIEVAGKARPGSSIVFLYSGHGLLDLSSYEAYFQGHLEDYELPQEVIDQALASCPEYG